MCGQRVWAREALCCACEGAKFWGRRVGLIFGSSIAQLGERQTEDLKVPGSIPGFGTFASFCCARRTRFCGSAGLARYLPWRAHRACCCRAVSHPRRLLLTGCSRCGWPRAQASCGSISTSAVWCSDTSIATNTAPSGRQDVVARANALGTASIVRSDEIHSA